MKKMTTRDWSTETVGYEIGVFQGCTISPYLFDTVFKMLLDTLEQDKYQSMGYKFCSSPSINLLSSVYTDDIQITINLTRESFT